MEVLPLIQNIRPSYRQRHEYAIVATFNADLRFFEQRVLSNLRARNVLFLMDEGQYQLLTQRNDTTANPHFAGVYYQVEPVVVPNGVFHPKFILCLSERRSRLIIGSGNVNRQGYMANAEIFSVIESENEQPDEATTLISEACNFLKDLSQGDFLSPAAKDFISNAITLQPQTEDLTTRQYYFFHSLHKPIVELATSKLAGEQISEIHIISPFLHGNDLIENLLAKFKNSKLNIYLQNNRTQFEVEAIKTLCQRYSQIELFRVSAPTTKRSGSAEQMTERYIHAKLLGFVTSKSAYSLTGSPNFTRAALGLSAHDGNIETALFMQHSMTDFRKLIKNQFLEIEAIDSVDKITSETMSAWNSKQPRAPIRILSAKYDSTHLRIDFIYRNGVPADLRNFEVICFSQGEEKHFPASLQDVNIGHFSVKCDLPIFATIAWIHAKKISDGKSILSERQWVYFPHTNEPSESIFNQDDFDRCVETGGIQGVWEALEIASLDDQPDWLIVFLQTWNLEGIFNANNAIPEKNMLGSLTGSTSTTQLEVKNENLRRGLETLLRPDMEEVLENILQKYREKIIEWLDEREVESVRMGLEYILVFDVLCLLLMKGFQKLIEGELKKKDAGMVYPQMQYGHMRVVAHNFVVHYLYDWEELLEKGNLALYSLIQKKLPPNIYLFHNARSAIAYALVKNTVSKIDLEEPVLFKKEVKNLVGLNAKEHCRSYLLLSDSVETLKGILQNYDLIIKDLGVNLDIEELRKTLRTIFSSR